MNYFLGFLKMKKIFVYAFRNLKEIIVYICLGLDCIFLASEILVYSDSKTAVHDKTFSFI